MPRQIGTLSRMWWQDGLCSTRPPPDEPLSTQSAGQWEWLTCDVTPVGGVRQVKSDKWKKRPCVVRYREYRDVVREHFGSVGPCEQYRFVLPMPASWSAKKRDRMRGMAHEQVPDLDNLIKGLWDAMRQPDQHIHTIAGATKVWGDSGQVSIGRRIE